MDIKEAIQELKPRLEEYLQEKGIRKKQFKCLNPNHDDKHPSMSFYKQADIVHCFACGETYDIIDLLSIDLGFGPKPKKQDFLEVIKYGCQQYGIPFEEIPSRKDYIEKCHKEVAKTDYFQKRGISSKTIKKYRLGYDENFSINKTIKISGLFNVFTNENTGENYFAILIPDATACCQQGIEFVWQGNHIFPEDYPQINEEITIIGQYKVDYTSDGLQYCYLAVSTLSALNN